MRRLVLLLVVGLAVAPAAAAGPALAHVGHGGGTTTGDGLPDGPINESGGMGMGMGMEMQMVPNGTVVNGNVDEVPPGCDAIAGNRSITVRGGSPYAEAGEAFSYDDQQIQVEPCTRVTVTFVNEDEVRHQWMVHGLPRSVYPGGMFTLEAFGGTRVTGTFVTGANSTTLRVHCSLPQHQQKGMHADLVVGDGGDPSGGTTTASAAGGVPGFEVAAGAVAVLLATVLVVRRR